MAVRRTAKLFVEGLCMVGFVAEIGGAEPKRRGRGTGTTGLGVGGDESG